ncbi:tobamovirus multiplication protein 1-like isoform x1 [Anaeramoeba ignava]|uniref:Tobamovirus multiplication protein 1-like isoform x1 n=1 Tax=Anaeramoeba ignava TaxID=1746090 RepID=A0A9Q0LTI5_ANAIG|nr:tobamovirus multiplication protein 1-like isoform x1 [Anaeramoeba ignava]
MKQHIFKGVQIGYIILISLILIVILIISSISKADSSDFEKHVGAVGTVLFMILSLCILIGGIFTFINLHSQWGQSQKNIQNIKLYKILLFVFGAVFFRRAIYSLFTLLNKNKFNEHLKNLAEKNSELFYFFMLIWYLIFEIIPISIMLSLFFYQMKNLKEEESSFDDGLQGLIINSAETDFKKSKKDSKENENYSDKNQIYI